MTNPKYENFVITAEDSANGYTRVLNFVWKIIIYEYIPGTPLSRLMNVNKLTMYNEIQSILSYMHSRFNSW